MLWKLVCLNFTVGLFPDDLGSVTGLTASVLGYLQLDSLGFPKRVGSTSWLVAAPIPVSQVLSVG